MIHPGPVKRLARYFPIHSLRVAPLFVKSYIPLPNHTLIGQARDVVRVRSVSNITIIAVLKLLSSF
jgi:hypothetical protein